MIKNIVSAQETRAIPSYIELADSERLVGDETEKPDSQNSEYTVLSEPSPERREGMHAAQVVSRCLTVTCSLGRVR